MCSILDISELQSDQSMSLMTIHSECVHNRAMHVYSSQNKLVSKTCYCYALTIHKTGSGHFNGNKTGRVYQTLVGMSASWALCRPFTPSLFEITVTILALLSGDLHESISACRLVPVTIPNILQNMTTMVVWAKSSMYNFLNVGRSFDPYAR